MPHGSVKQMKDLSREGRMDGRSCARKFLRGGGGFKSFGDVKGLMGLSLTAMEMLVNLEKSICHRASRLQHL